MTTHSHTQPRSVLKTFRLPTEMDSAIARLARRSERTESAVIRSLLATALKQNRKRVANEDDQDFDFG